MFNARNIASLLGNFFKPVGHDVVANPNPRISTNNVLRKGALISFSYSFWKNDPFPLVIVIDYMPGRILRGVNLHYLTYGYISEVVKASKSVGFSYRNIKPNPYISNAYRSYKWQGISKIKVFDTNFILKVIQTINPADVKAIRQEIENIIRQTANPANTAADQFIGRDVNPPTV